MTSTEQHRLPAPTVPDPTDRLAELVREYRTAQLSVERTAAFPKTDPADWQLAHAAAVQARRAALHAIRAIDRVLATELRCEREARVALGYALADPYEVGDETGSLDECLGTYLQARQRVAGQLRQAQSAAPNA